MNILLIHPPYFRFKYYFFSPMVPLGLTYLARFLLNAGHTVKILDIPGKNLSPKEIVNFLYKNKADLYGISCNVFNLREGVTLAEFIKKINPDSKIVIGGYATIFPNDEILRRAPSIDYVIRGEGEIPIVKLCEAIEGKIPFEKVPNLTFRVKNGDKIIQNKLFIYTDLNTLPLPAHELVEIHRYRLHPPYGRKKPAILVSVSRGCPFRCIYCSVNTKYRSRPIENVIRELKWLKKNFGIKEIYFTDPTFTLNKRYTRKLCMSMIEEDLNLIWTCKTRVDLVDELTLKIMKRAGCYMIAFGAETAADTVLKNIQKGTTHKDIINALKLCDQTGIISLTYFMVGNIGDSERTFRITERFIKKYLPDFPVFAPVTPFPGTKLYDIAIREGSLSDELNELAFSNENKPWPIYIPARLSQKNIEKWVSRLQKESYFNIHYILKRISRIGSVQELINYIRGVLWFIKELTVTSKEIIKY